MESPDPVPDKHTIRAIVASASRLEEAVKSGQDLLAAVAARRMVSSLKRFFPNSFQAESQLQRPAETTFPSLLSIPVPVLVSVPDTAYVETIGESVRQFKRAMTNGDTREALAALEPTGILRDVPGPADELQSLEMDLARKSGSLRLPVLPRIAKLTLWSGNLDEAEQYALEALRLSGSINPLNPNAEAVHDANMVVGLVALKRGDLDRSKQFLLASADLAEPFRLGTGGPNLTLANELLKKCEREVVVQYLERLRPFWTEAEDLVTKWVAAIHSGGDPEFDLLFLTS